MGKSRSNKQRGLQPDLIEWSEESIPAAEFITRFDLPQVVKLSCGNYGNFGHGTDIDVNQPFLLHTARNCEKVLAENIVWHPDMEQFIGTGIHIIIPVNYPGWFGICSEKDYNKRKPWTKLSDVPLSSTSSLLSTSPITCFKLSERTSSGEKLYLKRDYKPGEVFQLGELFVESITSSEPTCCINWLFGGKRTVETFNEVEYILAKDSVGIDLLLPLINKGTFFKVNNLNGTNEIFDAGALSRVADVIQHEDLPCYLNLVHGQAPQSFEKFAGTVRLDKVYREDTVVACSLGTPEFNLLEFPIESGIEFIVAKNNIEVLNHSVVQSALGFCLDNVLPYIISLKVIQNFFVPQHGIEIIPNKAISDGNESSGSHHNDFSEFSDAETDVRSEDTHYETIPCDKNKGKNATKIPPRNPIHVCDNETDEYLAPVNMRKQSVYSNVNNTVIKRNMSHTSSDNATGMVCPANSINDDGDKPLQIFRETNHPLTLRRLPSGGKERLDRFLQDSLEELNRIKSTSSECDDAIPDFIPDPPNKKEADEASKMKATLDAFLEEIFDCNNLEKGELSTNIHKIIDTKVTNNFRSSTEGMDNMADNSISALDLAARNVNAYLSNNFNASGVPHKRNSIELEYPSNGDHENTSSSSRSASSIYRQMKYAHYGRSESFHPDSPYTRTDSGIFVTPGYSLSESGYNRGVYQAMSEVSWTPPQDISRLTVEEVSLSLIYIGLKQKVVDQFFEQQIDGHQLLDMNEDLLKEGFPELNSLERKKVIDFINGWRPKKLRQEML